MAHRLGRDAKTELCHVQRAHGELLPPAENDLAVDKLGPLLGLGIVLLNDGDCCSLGH